MPITTKKGSQSVKAKPRHASVKSLPPKHARTIAELRQQLAEYLQRESGAASEIERLSNELQDYKRQLTESLEQQTATSEILDVIASSPTGIQRVLNVVAENAARLCEATDAQIVRLEGDCLRILASHGSLPTSEIRPVSLQLVTGRAVLERRPIHVHDLAAAVEEFPVAASRGMPRGVRTMLATPLLREDAPIGAIVIRRTEVHPFSEKQIALLKTFADQAVIAIENVRLFKDSASATRNCARRWSIRQPRPRYWA
jgi:two-component system, NtrC family, sensor kinase